MEEPLKVATNELLDAAIDSGFEWGKHSLPITHYMIQDWLKVTHRLNVLPKFYDSGSYSYVIHRHNGDATGWTKISGFMGKSFYTYEEAFEYALLEALKILKPEPEPKVEELEPKKPKELTMFKMDLGQNKFKIG